MDGGSARTFAVEQSGDTLTIRLLRRERWRLLCLAVVIGLAWLLIWLGRLYWQGIQKLNATPGHMIADSPLWMRLFVFGALLTPLVVIPVLGHLFVRLAARGLGRRTIIVTPTRVELRHRFWLYERTHQFERAAIRHWRVDEVPPLGGSLYFVEKFICFESGGRDVRLVGAQPEIDAVHQVILAFAPELGGPDPTELSLVPDPTRTERLISIAKETDGLTIRVRRMELGRALRLRLAAWLILPLVLMQYLQWAPGVLYAPRTFWKESLVYIVCWLFALWWVLVLCGAERRITISRTDVVMRLRVGSLTLLRMKRRIAANARLRLARVFGDPVGRVRLSLDGMRLLEARSDLVTGLTVNDALVVRAAIVDFLPELVSPPGIARELGSSLVWSPEDREQMARFVRRLRSVATWLSFAVVLGLFLTRVFSATFWTARSICVGRLIARSIVSGVPVHDGCLTACGPLSGGDPWTGWLSSVAIFCAHAVSGLMGIHLLIAVAWGVVWLFLFQFSRRLGIGGVAVFLFLALVLWREAPTEGMALALAMAVAAMWLWTREIRSKRTFVAGLLLWLALPNVLPASALVSWAAIASRTSPLVSRRKIIQGLFAAAVLLLCLRFNRAPDEEVLRLIRPFEQFRDYWSSLLHARWSIVMLGCSALTLVASAVLRRPYPIFLATCAAVMYDEMQVILLVLVLDDRWWPGATSTRLLPAVGATLAGLSAIILICCRSDLHLVPPRANWDPYWVPVDAVRFMRSAGIDGPGYLNSIDAGYYYSERGGSMRCDNDADWMRATPYPFGNEGEGTRLVERIKCPCLGKTPETPEVSWMLVDRFMGVGKGRGRWDGTKQPDWAVVYWDDSRELWVYRKSPLFERVRSYAYQLFLPDSGRYFVSDVFKARVRAMAEADRATLRREARQALDSSHSWSASLLTCVLASAKITDQVWTSCRWRATAGSPG